MHKKVLCIDNYDSFIHNLARYVNRLGFQTTVVLNDAITLKAIATLNPSHIILSPGPKRPEDAGILMEITQAFASHIPILGVCLGHQAIAAAFGGKIIPSKEPMHGKASPLLPTGFHPLFSGCQNPLTVGRYHSLIVEKDSLPICFNILAESEKREVMAIAHQHYPLWGVQFHPESVLTHDGEKMLENFLLRA